MPKNKISNSNTVGYSDVYILPLPKASLAKYKKTALAYSQIAKEKGVLACRELVSDELNSKGMISFTKVIKAKDGEVIITAFYDFISKKHRDEVMKKMFADPRMLKMAKEKPIFDMKKMHHGGFKILVNQ